MDHTKILKRAWHILWSYKVLWIFGFILALTAASWGGGGSSYSFGSTDFEGRPITEIAPDEFRRELEEGFEDFGRELERAFEDLEDFFGEGVRSPTVDDIITVVVAVLIFFLILFILGRIARYVADAAMIKMVDHYEETGEKLTFRQGLGLGWSQTAWRLFLINLTIDLPTIIVLGILFLLAFAPLFLWGTGVTSVGVVGTVGAIGLFFIWILVVIVVSVILDLLKQFFRRACAIDGLGVFASIRRGYQILRANLKDVGVMWIIMVGIGIAYPLVILPIGLVVLFAAVVLGGGSFLVLAGLTSLVTSGATPWIIAGLLAFPIFLLSMMIPLGFVGGLKETFVSSTWTLTYREVTALERLDPDRLAEALPEPEDEPEDDPESEEGE
jgi:hypothetical protein